MVVSHKEFPLNHPLDAIYAKMERANESFQRLNAEMNSYLNGDPRPYTVVGQLDDDCLAYVFQAVGKPHPPIRFPILTGEIIQHLRSCLDYLVVALAGVRNQPPLNNHQFPVCRTPEKFEKAEAGGIMKGISGTARDKIVAAQPYNHATPDTYSLAVLHDLNIRDKHRLLLLVSVAAQIGNRATAGTTDGSVAHISHIGTPQPVVVSDNGTEFFRIGLATPNPCFYAEAEITSQIAFDQIGSAKVVSIISALAELLGFTTNLIDSFDSEFPKR